MVVNNKFRDNFYGLFILSNRKALCKHVERLMRSMTILLPWPPCLYFGIVIRPFESDSTRAYSVNPKSLFCKEQPMERGKPCRKIQFEDQEFRRATFTGTDRWACVEVAMRDGVVGVRSSTDPAKNTIFYTYDEWQAFIAGVKDCEFEVPS